MNVSVELLSNNGLNCLQYDFWFDDRGRKFVLNHYFVKTRQTKRHHFKAVKIWSRQDQRHDNIERPYVSNEIQQKALDVFIKSLRFEPH